MKTLIGALAILSFTIGAAGACEYKRSVKATEVDSTTVASVAVPQSAPATSETLVIEQAQPLLEESK